MGNEKTITFCHNYLFSSTTGVKLGVEYTWVPDNECSDVSPKIMVSGIPQGTEKLRVSLTDRDVPSYNHGGGTAEYKGSNVIEAGALKYYSGPVLLEENILTL